MASNVYETLFILDSNRYARDPGGLSGSIDEIIQGLGGNVLASRLWIEQRLAYPIEGHQKGAYWLAYFELDTQRLGEFNRACQLNEGIVRHMTLKIDPRLVEPMLAHARGERAAVTHGEGATEVDGSEGEGEAGQAEEQATVAAEQA